MLAFLFPGQGSQKRGMGEGLFDTVPEFLAAEREIDGILGYSIRTLCLEDPDNKLRETQYTQPCLYVVNALHYYKAVAEGAQPDFVAGHSLGEYNALLAAGVFDFVTGLQLVKKRGELMAQARNGGMAAVIGLDSAHIAQLLQQHGLTGLDVANFNSPAQTVISGPVDEIQRAGPLFEAGGARLYMPLPVSAAFHSRYMKEASNAFVEFLRQFAFNEMRVPVIANVTGEPYPAGNARATVPLLLAKQITQSVQWTRSMRYLLDRGVTAFKEVGPGVVLTRLAQEIQQSARL